ncbi:cellobiohydrolase I-I [Crepidotus variabilis]|uniref:Glucanase n=1 Tax=Crepidotus variabilis TaxID=179855 RepID=A0A9P6EKZ1_9AGAR|nr:cellobiohydrolase I-I [Crepidotus variabilis]
MFPKAVLFALSLLAIVHGQQVGTNTAETHPTLPWQKCTKSGCTTQSSGKIVLDSNWRWLHTTKGYDNCYDGNTWNSTICPDNKTCASNCAVDGADYPGTYGITTSGNALTLKFVTKNTNGANIGSRVYLLNSDTKYEMFKVLNQEFTFDVDLSNLPCGLNGALYFSAMDADGGMGRFPANKAGAKYGTGYCDSQCPRDIKFINGEANVEGWNGSPNDPNAGTGQYGACCDEMDVWEANSISAAYTPHPCTTSEQTRCQGDACGGSDRYATVCDPDGCDFNSYRMGDTSFYGPGKTVDTKKKFTVVTQFITDTGTSSGTLSEIRRIYVQDGKVIQNSKVNIPGMSATYDSVTTKFCDDQKSAFGDTSSFQNKGGLPGISDTMAKGMVLVLSVWDDHAVNMLWLDSTYPTDADPTTPGIARGTCSTDSGKPTDVEVTNASASVTYSNIRFGDIGTTYSNTGTNPSNPGTPTTTPSAPQATQTKWGQCGGNGYSGPTACESGSTCHVVSDPWYSQCY